MQYPNIDGIPVTPQYSSKYHSPVRYNSNRTESGAEQGEIAFWASDAGRELLDRMTRRTELEIDVAMKMWSGGQRRRIVPLWVDIEATDDRAAICELHEGRL